MYQSAIVLLEIRLVMYTDQIVRKELELSYLVTEHKFRLD
jgi:hypothetical protein